MQFTKFKPLPVIREKVIPVLTIAIVIYWNIYSLFLGQDGLFGNIPKFVTPNPGVFLISTLLLFIMGYHHAGQLLTCIVLYKKSTRYCRDCTHNLFGSTRWWMYSVIADCHACTAAAACH